MRSTIINLAGMVGMAAAAAQVPAVYLPGYPTTCTVPTLTYGGNVATITQTFTSTYCPVCPEVITTYTTVYDAFCPTGLTQNVYTITETCAPNYCRTGVPPGFVTTVDICNVCGAAPVTATLTLPATTGPYATVVQNYPTVYQTWGPNGLVDNTYTVTASCAAAPCPAPANNAPAPGFVTTVDVCHTCGPTPITATLTVPTPAVNAAGTGNPGGVSPAQYTGAASSNNAGNYLAAGLAGVAAVAQLL